MRRWIVHVDMDEFFAAVEKLDRPELAGKPLLIGGSADEQGLAGELGAIEFLDGCEKLVHVNVDNPSPHGGSAWLVALLAECASVGQEKVPGPGRPVVFGIGVPAGACVR